MALNQTDGRIVGKAKLNLPKLTCQTEKFPGLHGDTLTSDMAFGRSLLTGIGDCLKIIEGDTPLNGGKLSFHHIDRTNMFAKPLVSKSGLTTKNPYSNCVEGISAGLSFHNQDNKQVLLECHVDYHKISREGHNWNISANSIHVMPANANSEKGSIQVRTNINGYCKACCGYNMDQSNYLNRQNSMCSRVSLKCGGLTLDPGLLDTGTDPF